MSTSENPVSRPSVTRASPSVEEKWFKQQVPKSFADVFYSSPIPMTISRPGEAPFIEVNDAFLDLFGYARDEVIGRTSVQLSLFADPADHFRLGDIFIERGSVKNHELVARTKTGEALVLLLSANITSIEGRNYLITSAVDITRYRRAEEAGQKTLNRLYAILSSMHVGMVLVTDESRVEFANQAFCDYFGIGESAADLIGIASPDFTEKTKNAYLNPEKEAARIREMVDRGQPVRSEEVPMRNGRSCVRDFIPLHMAGESAGRLWYHTDITERKQMEEELRRSEERLRLAKNTAGFGIYDHDLLSGEMEWDERIRGIWGVESGTPITMEVLLAGVHPDDRHGIEAGIKKAIDVRAADGQTVEYRVINMRDGTETWVRTTGRLLFESGQPVRFVGTVEDITLRKRIEDELRASRDKLKDRVQERTEELRRQAELLEIAHDAILLRAFDNRIVGWNRGAEEMYGYPKEEALGKDITKLLKTRFPIPVDQVVSTIDREGHWEGDLVRARKDGRDIVVLSRWAIQRDEDGNPIAIMDISLDITEHRSMEEHLRQAEKMEAIGTLAGGIAHDFNNMLAVILGNTELALDDVGDDQALRNNLDQILKASKRGRDLVKQIMTFSRKTERKRQTIAVLPLLKETFQLLRSSIPTNIDMALDLRSEDPAIIAESSEIQQIIMNLASNAEHAMRENGGKLTMRVEERVFRPGERFPEPDMRPGSYLVLTVLDSGVGMTDETRKKAFDPFFTTKGVGEGTGMGLAVVYGIVRNLNGGVTVVSEPGKGTTFHVYLPLVPNTTDERRRNREPVRGGKERILFVDDEAPVTEMNRALLERLGYRVTATTDAEEALTLFSEDPTQYDLVITDQAMPHLTGMQLATKMRGIRKEVPIILCTGYSHTASAEKMHAVGVAGFLMKPITRKKLGRAIRRVLDR